MTYEDIKVNNAKKQPTIVIGTPVNTPSKVEMLYLASLNAPHIGNDINNTIPSIPYGPKLLRLKQIYNNNEGATPKDTKSANESNSFPSSLDT